ncbi:MAG: CopG family transcriptional regulator [Desulfurococcales archaeon]|nr:CopG family transcriptional regulator [Desulfurococcales archaeon]
MAEEKVTVRISRELYEKVKKYIEETGGFESVDEFVEFVVAEALETAGEAFSEEDKKKIEERLKDLGYM